MRKRLRESKQQVHFAELYASVTATRGTRDCSCVIFSMDRALQLHALLSSYFHYVQDPVPVHVIYRASTPKHAQAYDEVFALFKDQNVHPVLQESKESFRPQLLSLLERLTSFSIFFLVDDIIFTDSVRLQDMTRWDLRDYVPSLRMGKHLVRCFTMDQNQPLPVFEAASDSAPSAAPGQLLWSWESGALDWNYPLSVDGHFFIRKEILTMSRMIEFSAPNTYEGRLQEFRPYFLKRTGVCFEHSKIVNLAINKVQTENNNLHGAIHQDTLLEAWFQGKRMDFSVFHRKENPSAHIDSTIELISRS